MCALILAEINAGKRRIVTDFNVIPIRRFRSKLRRRYAPTSQAVVLDRREQSGVIHTHIFSLEAAAMKLSRTVTYALQATVQLAESDSSRPIPCSQLASEGQMPERFLLQILRNLVNHGILRSTRGVDGGYSLVREPAEISLLDVIEAIDGPIDSGIPDNKGFFVTSQIHLRNALQEISASARKQLDQIKVSQLIALKPPPQPNTDVDIKLPSL